VRESFIEALEPRVDHSHLPAEEKVANLVDPFLRRR
jgi:hypothetical protein